MSKQVFFDPHRKRWKRLRRLFDVAAVFGAIVGIIFVAGLIRMKPNSTLSLHSTVKRYRALSSPSAPKLTERDLHHSAHRRTSVNPSDVVLN
ncbi:MAG: hypothetical protein ABI142_03445, partial [Bryocella sp.]